MHEALSVGGQAVRPGERVTLDLPVPGLYTHAGLTMPVQVLRGRRDGPCLFVSAAIHGDELNGVEVVRRLLKSSALKRMSGTLIAVPVVNVHGIVHRSRYMPDGRDLNRSFPGSERGSLAARLAQLFMSEVVAHCHYGIDLHTGAGHRTNLPQIRAAISDEETEKLARSFGVPVIINSDLRDGSLRQAAADQGVRTLLYEAGEALRFDEVAIRAGVRGVVNVMRSLGMLPAKTRRSPPPEPFIARSSAWVRAPESGILRSSVALGAHVSRDQLLGTVADPFGEREVEVRATSAGLVIGRLRLPLVNEGDAILHIARFKAPDSVAESVEAFRESHAGPDPYDLPGKS